MRFAGTLLGLMLLGLTGCQCCALTEHYASAVDCISDHEHHFERFYHPGWDLNRIGRSDWCSYPKNRLCCRCVCDRCRPAPCEYIVCRETGRLLPPTVTHPDWSEQPPPESGVDERFQPEEAIVPPTPLVEPESILEPELP